MLISLFGNFAQLVSQALTFKGGLGNGISREVGPNLDECLIKDNDASSKIAVVTVDGIITGQTVDQAGNNMVDVIKAQLDRAKDDRRVKAVILKVDSPGGEVLASDEIYRAINDFQKDSSKPVVCSMGSLAASGGYYISSPCRWIVANELTITGSIGVIMHTWNYRGLMDKIGVRPDVFKSGKFKDMLSGERETNEIPAEERVMVQGLIDETYQKFKDVVAAGRDARARQEQKGRHGRWRWTGPITPTAACCPARRPTISALWINSGIFTTRWIARNKSPAFAECQFDRIPRALRYLEFFPLARPERIVPFRQTGSGRGTAETPGGRALFPVAHLHQLIERNPAHRRGQRARREHALCRRPVRARPVHLPQFWRPAAHRDERSGN